MLFTRARFFPSGCVCMPPGLCTNDNPLSWKRTRTSFAGAGGCRESRTEVSLSSLAHLVGGVSALMASVVDGKPDEAKIEALEDAAASGGDEALPEDAISRYSFSVGVKLVTQSTQSSVRMRGRPSSARPKAIHPPSSCSLSPFLRPSSFLLSPQTQQYTQPRE